MLLIFSFKFHKMSACILWLIEVHRLLIIADGRFENVVKE